MITVNFTIFIQVALFLVFLWVANKIAYRPLLRTMDTRAGKIEDDHAAADAGNHEAQRLHAEYVGRLSSAHQAASQRLHKARYDAHRDGRAVMDGLRHTADREIAAWREAIEKQIDVERQKLPGLIPGLVEAAARQVTAEGVFVEGSWQRPGSPR